MSLLNPTPSLPILARLLRRVHFRAWQRRRKVSLADLSPYLRRDIGMDR